MAASSSTKKRSLNPCGCESDCNCGGGCGGTCATCQDDGYSRPKFFAGQLLTEGDLQQLSDYVVAKNRLHARHLFGSGVACGLEVTCYPCGGGKVIVDPGYALDCCGNDIVISCPQELDIIQMIRDLRRKQHGGADCGDPCASATTAQTALASQRPPSSGVYSPTSATTKVSAPDCYKYCLYVNYCEQPSDPVSPYVTGDPCGSQTCENTRVREGFRFVLRCPDPTEPEPAICKRLNDCLGDAASHEGYRKNAELLQKYGLEIEAAFHSALSSRPKLLTTNFSTYFTQHTSELSELLAPAKTDTLSSAHALVEATLALSSDLALLAIQTSDVQKPWVGKVGSALALLKTAATKLENTTFQNMLPTALEQAYTASLAETTQSLLAKTVDLANTASTGPSVAGLAAAAPQPVDDDLIRLLAYKVAFGQRLQNQMVLDTDSLRAQLIFRLQQEAMKTRCDLFDTISSAPKLQAATTKEVSLAFASVAGHASLTLGRAFIEMERACFCNALNPPCPSCDDPGVLLACITVADCKVKDICNLDRQFVLSPVALRYWIPEITRIGRAIEKACCPRPCSDKPYASVQEGPTTAHDSNRDYAALIFRFLQYSCPEKGPAQYALESLDEFVTARAEASSVVPPAQTPDFAAELYETRQQLDKLRAEHESLAEKLKGLLDKKKGNP